MACLVLNLLRHLGSRLLERKSASHLPKRKRKRNLNTYYQTQKLQKRRNLILSWIKQLHLAQEQTLDRLERNLHQRDPQFATQDYKNNHLVWVLSLILWHSPMLTLRTLLLLLPLRKMDFPLILNNKD